MGSSTGWGLCLTLVVAGTLLTGCQKKNSASEISADNLVTSEDKKVDRLIGEVGNQFQVIGTSALDDKIAAHKIALATSDDGKSRLAKLASLTVTTKTKPTHGKTDGPLVLGFPVKLLKENYVFGGAITRVTDKANENVGMLRLSELTPMLVKPVVAKNSEGQFLFSLLGCATGCTEGTTPKALLTIPIVGVDDDKDTVLVDLSGLGKDLNLVQMKDPTGRYTQMVTKTVDTVSFDYSLSTLVFDIETKMVPGMNGIALGIPNVDPTVFTARWYLRLASAFDPYFKPRDPAKGVGFFLTQRTDSPKVQRFGKPGIEGGVKYFIKNVPTEYRKAFAAAFDEWNEKFVEISGKKLFSYEYLETTDPRYNLVITGDSRYNVLEWDIDNLAPYGGYGPSMANQATGETLSANVLIQGPKIVTGYKKWFDAFEKAKQLRERGLNSEAERAIRDVSAEITAQDDALRATRYTLTLGEHLEFNIGAQTSPLEDPAFARNDFDPIPAGVTFQTYLDGYFQNMVEHELGHNLGLRHNFRGNMGAKDELGKNGVSHSVMEYLGKEMRHLDRIGPYDMMAIKYGYTGVVPTRTDMYCTDQELSSVNNPEASAECSKDDNTNDPFGYFEKRLTRALSLLVPADSNEAPSWTVEDLSFPLGSSVVGMGLYASSAQTSAERWTNFGKKPNRPKDAGDIEAYVYKTLMDKICDEKLDAAAKLKGSDARDKAEASLKKLRANVKVWLGYLEVFDPATLACPSAKQ